jgi:hypothetical protein
MTSAHLTNQSAGGAVCEPTVTSPSWLQRMAALYQEDHQTQFLTLQAEAESLLQQLQALNQQRLADQTLPHQNQN